MDVGEPEELSIDQATGPAPTFVSPRMGKDFDGNEAARQFQIAKARVSVVEDKDEIAARFEMPDRIEEIFDSFALHLRGPAWNEDREAHTRIRAHRAIKSRRASLAIRAPWSPRPARCLRRH